MKKNVKLTEKDLTRIVKNVINEETMDKEMFSEKIDELYQDLYVHYKNSKRFIVNITNKLNSLTNEISNSNLSNDDKEELFYDLDEYEDGNIYLLSNVLDKIYKNMFGEEDEY